MTKNSPKGIGSSKNKKKSRELVWNAKYKGGFAAKKVYGGSQKRGGTCFAGVTSRIMVRVSGGRLE